MNKKIKKFYKDHKIVINCVAIGGVAVAGFLIGRHIGVKIGYDDYQEALLSYAKESGRIAHNEPYGKFVLEFFPKEATK